MLLSVLQRVFALASLAILALGGYFVWSWWELRQALGAEAYETFAGHASSWYGMVILVGISWAFFNHMSSGVRHFVLDIGAGYEIDTNKRWSVATTASGIILTAVFWAALLLL